MNTQIGIAAVRASLCVFCLLVPLTIAGANIAWGLVLASLVALAACGGAVALGAHRSAFEIPLWIYFGVAILSVVLGMDPSHSLHALPKDAHKVWLYTLFSVALATEPAPQALWCMAAGFAAASLVGIGQVAWSLAAQGEWVRAHAFVHPVTFGEQAAVAALGACCFLAESEDGIKAPVPRRAAWALLGLSAAALLLSQTRGALAALIGGLAAVSWFVRRLRRPLIVALGVALLVIVLIERHNFGRALITEMYAAAGSWDAHLVGGPHQRLALWKAAWLMGNDHVWTGVGLDNYRAALPRYLAATFSDGTRSWGSAHNIYLHHFAERGLLGVGALGIFLGAFWIRALQRTRQSASAWNLWAFGTATAFLVMNVTEDALQTEILWILVFFVWVWAETRHRKVFPQGLIGIISP